MSELTIKEEFHDRTFTTLCIDGLSVAEMNTILANHDALGDIMSHHGHGSAYTSWKCGYGIYGIRHVGGHLFVTIGNSCD